MMPVVASSQALAKGQGSPLIANLLLSHMTGKDWERIRQAPHLEGRGSSGLVRRLAENLEHLH
jgi:hypothetical protein